MAHNANYGRAGNCIFIILNLFLDNLLFNRDFNLLFNLCAKLGCNDCGGIIVDNLVNRCHNAEGNKLLITSFAVILSKLARSPTVISSGT